tara:strand:+ start:339 stop:881 length:543 start_codon:yes stop_codon:yes gene_type:complete
MYKTLKINISIFAISISFILSQDNSSFYNLEAIDLSGNIVKMNKYKGKKILIVNVASKCGYTPQYKGLQILHENYNKELAILGFPSNNFLWQEPGSNEEIKSFCKVNYGVTFDMFEKTNVKGRKQHPIYQWLSSSKLNGWNDKSPSWNFCKYLIDNNGNLIEYFDMSIEPNDTLITKYFN